MSELLVKFCAGTNFHVLRGLCCVTFRTPSIVLANLDLRYVRHAWASASVSNEPTVMNVCVTATPGPTTVGLFNATPKKSVVEPDPFAAGTETLYLSKLPGPVMYSLRS